MARSRMARLFPTLPPSASSALAMTAPHQRHADIAESSGNRSMRLMNCDPHRAHARESFEYRVRHTSCGRLNQTEPLRGKCVARAIDDFVIRNGVHDLVGARRGSEIDLKIEIDREALPHFCLVDHHAVVRVERKSLDEYSVG